MLYTQPQSGAFAFDPTIVPQPLALFVGAAGAVEQVYGQPMTRGSAAVIAPCIVGQGARQAATNTGIYIPRVPPALPVYVAVWHGVLFGAPSGSTPKLVGLAGSSTSQSADIIGVEFLNSTDLQITLKSSNSNATRTFAGSAPPYNVPVTIVGAYDSIADVARLHVCANGVVTSYSSAVSGGMVPNITGTEVFCVGSDVIEIPSRFINGNVVFAAVMGGVGGNAEERQIALNPWSLLADVDEDEEAFILQPLSGAITGALNVTLGDAAISSAGTVAVAGAANISLSPVAIAASGGVVVNGGAAVALDGATLAAAGSLPVSAALAVTLGSASLASAGNVPVVGSLGVTLADAVLVATGGGVSPITGTLSVTLGSVTISAAGGVSVAGSLGLTLANAVLVASGGSGVVVPSPARTYIIQPETRIYAIQPEDRTLRIRE